MRSKLAGILLATLAASAVLGPVAAAEERTLATLTDIRQESGERSTRLIFESTSPLTYTYYSPDPLTLVIDLPEVDASKVPAKVNVGTQEVESVRVTNMARADGHKLVRVEVRLASLVPYQIFSKDNRLNVLCERSDGIRALAPAREQAAPPRSEPPPAAEPAAPAAEHAAPRAETPVVSSAATVIEAQNPSQRPARKAPASRLLAVEQSSEGGELALAVKADGKLQYQDFYLSNPDRLVIDFSGVTNRVAQRSLEVKQGPVARVRVAQFSQAEPKVTRLVLDLDGKPRYRIIEGSDGIKIVFGQGAAAAPPTLASLPNVEAALEAAPGALSAPELTPVPAVPEGAAPEAGKSELDSYAAKIVGSDEKKYTGHPITMDFKDGDLQDIFRLFADISGLNVVVNPGISGKVTLKLVEVPWDQALDLILKANGLGYTREENVIRIARLADLQNEEKARRTLSEERELAGDLVTWRKSLSYARAESLGPVVTKVALSARGSIISDARTNTMIITDLPARLEKAKDLIADLDRPNPQVEIEARIVVTSRNFTRELGIQWGWLNQRTAQYGNTLDRTFPHSIILNGQGTPGAGLDASQNGLATTAGIGQGGRGYMVNLPSNYNTSFGISMGNLLGNFNLDAALTALESQGRGRILSTPRIATQNNMAAEIKQGVQLPIQIVQNNTVTVTFKDAVLTLKVTPQITEANTVILNLEVENNEADFARVVGSGAAAIPPIKTQSAKTMLLVADGATAVIGGIYKSSESWSRDSTPLLGDVPIIGYLFRNRKMNQQNDELLLFITPKIIRG
jgi:type IV pilus secretin PilQ/predicted competence protein